MTAYAVLLGLVFAAKENPLPLRGVYAAAFMGLAIACAVAYLAFLKQGAPIEAYVPKRSRAETQLVRTVAFIDWVNSGVANRRNALRASVVAFAAGVVFIPAAFIGATGGSSNTATATPTPPSIPRDVPQPVADAAVRLFNTQVETYLAAVDRTKSDSTAARSEKVESCTGYFQLWESCAWTTEAGVERSFRRLALVALLFVIAVPLVVSFYERLGSRSVGSLTGVPPCIRATGGRLRFVPAPGRVLAADRTHSCWNRLLFFCPRRRHPR